MGNSVGAGGICVFDGSETLASTRRHDNYHMEDTEHNREQSLRFYASMTGAGYAFTGSSCPSCKSCRRPGLARTSACDHLAEAMVGGVPEITSFS